MTRTLKGDTPPPVALEPATFVRRNEAVAHLMANGYVAGEIASLYGISKSRTCAIARAEGVTVTRGGSRRGFRSTDPLKIIAAARAPGVVAKEQAARNAGVAQTTSVRVMRALDMERAFLRLYRLRRRAARRAND